MAPKKQKTILQLPTPSWLLMVMKQLHGHEPRLVVEMKTLTQTDLDRNNSKLVINLTAINDPDFLRVEEKAILNDLKRKEAGIYILLIDPKGKEHTLALKKYGNRYALIKAWNSVVLENELKAGDSFPIWSFRSGGNGLLCLAIVPDPNQISQNALDGNIGCSEEDEIALGNLFSMEDKQCEPLWSKDEALIPSVPVVTNEDKEGELNVDDSVSGFGFATDDYFIQVFFIVVVSCLVTVQSVSVFGRGDEGRMVLVVLLVLLVGLDRDKIVRVFVFGVFSMELAKGVAVSCIDLGGENNKCQEEE